MTPITVICALILVFCGVRILLRRISSVLDNIPGPPGKSIIAGNLAQFHDPDDWAFQHELEENYAQVVKIHGILGDRQLFVFDPAALHSILVQEQDIYEELQMLLTMDVLLFGKGILSSSLDEHRKYRKVMTPAFSTVNLRRMIPSFYEVAQRAWTRDGLIGPNVISGPRTEHDDRYAVALRAMFLAVPLLPLIVKLFPPAFLRAMINFVPWPALQKLRDIVDLIDAKATELVQDRKMAIRSGKLDLNDVDDIMSLLAKSNASAEDGISLTDEELISCTSAIIFAATDSTTSAMNRLFETLAMYPDVQEKLRAEILAAPEELDHDALTVLPYLDGVVHEILRLYPPASLMFREAMTDAVLPLGTPITGVDGKAIHAIHVPKGTAIYIAIAAANHNKRIWGQDTLEFRPERWTKGKADSVTTKMSGIYGNTMTFIGGGRSCMYVEKDPGTFKTADIVEMGFAMDLNFPITGLCGMVFDLELMHVQLNMSALTFGTKGIPLDKYEKLSSPDRKGIQSTSSLYRKQKYTAPSDSLNYDDNIPVYDARHTGFDASVDIDNLRDILPMYKGEIPANSCTAVGYTISNFVKASGRSEEQHLSFHIQWVVVLGEPE
ncbi:cytochrome P450 [Mycena olivaceomarginata]|nr:cytochrome P450 [Mycena olivaceomarginata]